MVDDETHGKRRGFSRRRFVKAAGASGVAVGLAGCLGGGGGGTNNSGSNNSSSGNNESQISTKPPSGDITIQWGSDKIFKDARGDLNKALHDAGMPDNITVKFIAGSFTTGDRQSKYKNILSAGQKKPTLLQMDTGWTIPFIARDQIVNLSEALPDKITKKAKNDYLDSSVSAAMQNGDLYAMPIFSGAATIQYRKDLLRKAGYSDSDFEKWAKNSMSWKKFSQVVKQGMDETGKEGFLFQGDSYAGLACCDFNEFMSSWGGAYFGGRKNLFGPVNDRPITVDEKPVVKSLRMVRTFIHGGSDSDSLSGYKNISPQAVTQYQEESSRKPFTNGDAIALRNWGYSVKQNGQKPTKKNDNTGFGKDLGVMPIPYGVKEGKSNYKNIGGITSGLGGWNLAINPNAPDNKKAAAYQVIKATMDEGFMIDLLKIAGDLPPNPSVLQSKKAKNAGVLGRYAEPLRIALKNTVPRPVTTVWPQESTQIYKEVNGTFRQQKAPKKAMSGLKSALKQIEKKGA